MISELFDRVAVPEDVVELEGAKVRFKVTPFALPGQTVRLLVAGKYRLDVKVLTVGEEGFAEAERLGWRGSRGSHD